MIEAISKWLLYAILAESAVFVLLGFPMKEKTKSKIINFLSSNKAIEIIMYILLFFSVISLVFFFDLGSQEGHLSR